MASVGVGVLALVGSVQRASAKDALLKSIAGANYGRDLASRPLVGERIEALEQHNPTPAPLAHPELLTARWRLTYTTSDSILGTKRSRLFRPRYATIFQHIDATRLKAMNEEWVLAGLLRNAVRADLQPREDGTTVDVQFKRFNIGWIPIPAPSSFRGFLNTTYLDEDLRISRGDKSNLFVLERDGDVAAL